MRNSPFPEHYAYANNNHLKTKYFRHRNCKCQGEITILYSHFWNAIQNNEALNAWLADSILRWHSGYAPHRTGSHFHHYAYHAFILREHRTYIGEKRPARADAKLRWRSGPTAGQARKWVARLQRFLNVISCRQRPWFAVIAPPSPPLHTLSRSAPSN